MKTPPPKLAEAGGGYPATHRSGRAYVVRLAEATHRIGHAYGARLAEAWRRAAEGRAAERHFRECEAEGGGLSPSHRGGASEDDSLGEGNNQAPPTRNIQDRHRKPRAPSQVSAATSWNSALATAGHRPILGLP